MIHMFDPIVWHHPNKLNIVFIAHKVQKREVFDNVKKKKKKQAKSFDSFGKELESKVKNTASHQS